MGNWTRILVLVGTGGMIGSIFRYLVQLTCTRWFSISFPVGTFVVNLAGSFVIGAVYGFTERHNSSSDWRLFLATGICGGFTTFSAFAIENIVLLRQGAYLTFISYTILSVALALLAVVAGYAISR